MTVSLPKLPTTFEKFVSAETPKDARLMAAKGMFPMPPAVLATACIILSADPEESVRTAARETLLGMPASVARPILETDATHPMVLDFFARERVQEEALLEPVLLNSATSDETFLAVAPTVPERFTQMIASNQVRLLRKPEIAEALKKNPHALKSVMDTMISFLRMNGVVIHGESAELTAAEIHTILTTAEPTGASALPELLVKELDEAAGETLPEEKKKSLYQLVAGMNVAEKVKLALRGNKEARSMLIKDSNKVVASAVVKSPKIGDGEVLTIAQMRSTHDEVIRIIASNPDWTKNYNLQAALANNPKTPFQVALRFTRQLRINDLLKISKNKNVPAQLSKIAAELFAQKRK